MRDRLAPWLHAFGVAVAAAIAYYLAPEAERPVIVAATVGAIAKGLGWFLRSRPPTPLRTHRGQIVVLQKHVHRAIHDAVNGLAALKAEIDMAIDDAFNASDTTPPDKE